MKHAGGRPSKYDDKFIDQIDAYLEFRTDTYTTEGKKVVKLPTIEGFARYINVDKTTLYEWEQHHEKFSHALDKIRQEQQQRLLDNGLSGDYNPTIAKLVLSANHGMRERADLTSNDQTLTINVTKYDGD